MNYIGFSDESYITASRYSSTAFFSFHYDYAKKIRDDLCYILYDSNVSEFRWKKLKTAKYKFCAIKLLNLIFKYIREAQIRIDIIIWDTQDERHSIQNRDDLANFERLFYQLLQFALKKRPHGSNWKIFPDKRNGIDWKTIHDCIQTKSISLIKNESFLWKELFSDRYFHINYFKSVCSKENPENQVADLFAGMAVFSISSYNKYSVWLSSQEDTLFSEEDQNLTNAEKERFVVMQHFDSLCKVNELGVSLNSKRCFYTPNPSNPINFWHYQPQTHLDKAPIKNKKNIF